MDEQPQTSAQKKKIAKIVVNRELCIGAGPCIALAGKTFTLDAENKAAVIEPRGDTDEDVFTAAAACPVSAIYLYDEDGNQLFPEK